MVACRSGVAAGPAQEALARHGPLLEPWQHHPRQGRGAALQDRQGRQLPCARQRVHLPGLRALRAVSTAPPRCPPRACPCPGTEVQTPHSGGKPALGPAGGPGLSRGPGAETGSLWRGMERPGLHAAQVCRGPRPGPWWISWPWSLGLAALAPSRAAPRPGHTAQLPRSLAAGHPQGSRARRGATGTLRLVEAQGSMGVGVSGSSLVAQGLLRAAQCANAYGK